MTTLIKNEYQTILPLNDVFFVDILETILGEGGIFVCNHSDGDCFLCVDSNVRKIYCTWLIIRKVN